MDILNRQPGFWGVFCASSAAASPFLVKTAGDEIWNCSEPGIRLYAGRTFAKELSAWQTPSQRGKQPSVFVTGSLFLGEDALFDAGTCVTGLPLCEAPDRIAQLYERHGVSGFSYIDGEFSIILFDPRSGCVYLVADRYGSHDIYLRRQDDAVIFGSHPYLLLSGRDQFHNEATAFFFAHEGFFPAPFTPFRHVTSVGRSRFIRIEASRHAALETQRCRYRQVNSSSGTMLPTSPSETFHALLQNAIDIRSTENCAILLSGGVDSSLLANLSVSGAQRPVAITGTVRGWVHGEREIEASKKLANLLRLQHYAVRLDADDDSLPEDYTRCVFSWMTGARLTLPLWHRYASLIRSLLGDGYRVLAGQTADTIADNNYTLPSTGYTIRRALFSSWMFRLVPAISAVSPRPDCLAARTLRRCISSVAGDRVAFMFDSLLNGLTDRANYYGGRVFGYGEMPGLSRAYFPMLTSTGFSAVTEWYCDNFVRPLTGGMTSETFYRDMIELSLDMNMLHLDSRLLFHVYRMEGASASLPFMDARLVNFFGTIPYSDRSIFREPKHLVRNELRRPGMQFLPLPDLSETKSQEQLLLAGSLGVYLRQIIGQLTFLDRAPGLLDFIDEAYLESQVRGFIAGKPGVNAKFISKLGAIEHWSRAVDALPR